MTTVADFIKLPKKDSHFNLDLGMRYPSYVAWAGFYVPGFPEDGSPVKPELSSEIQDFTQTRIGSEDDIHKLISLSMQEAAADNISEINGTVNFSLLSACDTPESFVSLIISAAQKYENTIKLNKILALDTAAMNLETVALASSLLGSGAFKGVYLYGSNLADTPEKYAGFVRTARDHSIPAAVNASSVKDSKAFVKIIDTLNPACIVQGDFAFEDKDALSAMKASGAAAIVTPNPSTAVRILTTADKAMGIKTLLEGGLKVHLGTETILLYNKSISQFASDLCNTGSFSKDEMISLIQNW